MTDDNKMTTYTQRKEKHPDYYKEYREKNRETLRAYIKEYYKIWYARQDKEYKEQANKKRLEYYHSNKEKFLVKTVCECGDTVMKYCIQRHYRSKRHQRKMENKNKITNSTNDIPLESSLILSHS